MFIATQLNWTQLNSTDPVEQRTAKSVVFLFMTSQPTNWVNCCSRCRVEFSWVQLSWVELCRYKRAFTTDHLPNIIFLASNRTITQVANRPLIRSLSPKTTSKYCKSIHNADWEAVLAHVNVDRCYEVFQSKISNCFNSNFPLVRLLPRDAYA